MPKQLPADFQTVETRCGRESHTRPRGPSESPDGVDPNIRRTRKTQRDGHNSGVKIWSLCSVSSILSHANLWTTLSNPCNKVRGKYICKEVSCIFLTACVVYYCVCYHCVGMYPVYICIFLHESADDYTTPSPLLPGVVAPDKGPIYGLNRTKPCFFH